MTSSTTTPMELIGALMLENGKRWGEAAEPWQMEDAKAILPHPNPVPYHFLTRPRGASKTTDLAAINIGVLLGQAPAGSKCYSIASDQDQGALLVDALAGFVVRNPALARLLKVDNYRVTSLQNGATLDVVPADAASAFGLRPFFVTVDEIAQWPETRKHTRIWEAIFSAIMKVPGCRLVLLTSAGDPSHWSHRILVQAQRSKMWRVNEVPGPSPWVSPAELEEQKMILTESSYMRLHLNKWTAAEDRLSHPDDLAKCVTLTDYPLESVPGTTYRISVDIGIRHDRTAVGVCHAEPIIEEREDKIVPLVRAHQPQRRVVLDRHMLFKGSRAKEVSIGVVEDHIIQLHHDYNGAKVILDPYQAIQLKQRLKARGIPVEEYIFSAQSIGRLAATLHLLIRDHLLAIPDDQELFDELSNVRLKETSPGVLRIDHDPDKHDDQAIMLALAAHDLVGKRAHSQARLVSAAEHQLPNVTRSRNGLRPGARSVFSSGGIR